MLCLDGLFSIKWVLLKQVLLIRFHCRFFFSADAIEVPLALLHSGTQFSYILTITALRLRACTVFLRDVATSRQSSNKFGSALDFRNVIKGLTPSR